LDGIGPVILSGVELAGRIRSRLASEIASTGGRPPGLAVVMVGDDPASSVYVSSKEKACARIGMAGSVLRLRGDSTQEEALAAVRALNEDPAVDGILCQLPLPAHISPSAVSSAIDPSKDVDGLHPENVGRLWRGEEGLFPCTPLGIMALLGEYRIGIEGVRVVVIGRSDIVGKPIAAMMLHANATVTLAHSHTRELQNLCREADVLVAAVGRPGMITREFLKQGSVVIDVGISRTSDGLRGDVDFGSASHVCSAVTPVPGGVGPLTIALLLSNTVKAWRKHLA
jgi:methylenetetrahydrofolate dehydrogenase (NADP+) / methenyltetrahydrofolate cyclohydrolase